MPSSDSPGKPDNLLAGLLIELSIAMQKHAIYPVGHPLLNDAVDGVMKKLALLLEDRPGLSLGIARRQLIVEGVATDPNHPLLKELAGRLHKHDLGALKFNHGLTREELGGALATIAADAGRANKPLGDKAEEISARWTNVRLFPLNYDPLELLNQEIKTQPQDTPVELEAETQARDTPVEQEAETQPQDTQVEQEAETQPQDTQVEQETETQAQETPVGVATSRAGDIWVAMARAALMLDENADAVTDTANTRVLADAIERNHQDEAYAEVVVGYLQQIANELKSGGTREALEVRKRVSALVTQLSPETLKRLLHMGGDASRRRQFLLDASQGMTVEAVLQLVPAASQDGRQTISHAMTQLFSKLSKYAESKRDPLRRAIAEASVKEQMTKLISEWTGGQQSTSTYVGEPERILQMGFEIGVMGARFENALDAMLSSARLAVVLDLLDRAPDAEFAESVWSYLDSHDILWTVLTKARIDFDILERIVRRKRLSAVDPVIDTAEKVKDSRTRERLLDMVTELGDDVGPYVARRIEGARPDLRRDLFLTLGKLPNIPADFDASRFLLHSDPAVRREAVRLLLKFVEVREQAILAGLADTDERATFYALTAAQETGCPSRGVSLVRERVEKGGLDSSLMTLAIRVLAAADSGVGLALSGRGRTSALLRSSDVQAANAIVSKKTYNWLLGKVASKSIFGKWKLQPKSPEMLAALGALSAYWNYEPDVQEIVSLATRSNDPELRKALSAGRVTGKFKPVTGDL